MRFFAIALILLLQDSTADELAKKLAEGSEEEQKSAADALVKKGKEGRAAVVKARESEKSADIRKRYERVALRIDAGTDAVEGKVAGDVSIILSEPTLSLELTKKGDKVLHIKSPLRFEGPKDVTVSLTKGRMITFKDSLDLAILGPDKKPFHWDLTGGKPQMTEYGNFMTPKWAEGTLVVIVYEFTIDKKTVKLRTPVIEVTKK